MIAEAQIKKIAVAAAVLLAFGGGFLVHVFYQRWTAAPSALSEKSPANASVPSPAAAPAPAVETTFIEARDVDKIRSLAGGQATIRGRVFRVSKSSRSNTYFINFGPSRAAFTAVIFPSSAEQFEKASLSPKNLDGKEIEVSGEIKDHPQYGLEMILEEPGQVKIVRD